MTCAMSKRINNAKKFPYLDEMHPEDRERYLSGEFTQLDTVRFLCSECGKYYKQVIKERKNGYAHAECSYKSAGLKSRLSEDYVCFNDLSPEYQEKCRNKELSAKDKADFVCPICGKIYTTLLHSHKQGACCRSCASIHKRSACQSRKDYSFIDDIHPDDRCLIEQGKVNNKSKVRIKCSDCGEYFPQVISSRANGFTRCRACKDKANGIATRRREYEFVNPLREDYAIALANGEIRTQDRVVFICPVHGEYEQILMSGQKHGCQTCALSLYPKTLYDFLLNFTNNIIVNDRKQISPLEIDFYLPDYKVGFEFNDIHTHRTLWKEQIEKDKTLIGKPVKYHYNKFYACKEKGIRLIQIWDVEWQDERIRPILESVIRNALGHNDNKIFARNCELIESNSKDCNAFFNINHIQGAAKGKGYFTLKHNGNIVGAICYTTNQRILTSGNSITISRMCFAMNTTIVGGASRLLNAVIKKTNCRSIEYLVLNDYFNGISFEATDWKAVSTNIMVRYYDRETKKLYYRQISRRNEFKQRCLDNKMDRYYTSGTTVYKKEISPP